MMTMSLSGFARTSSKDNVRSWIAKFQDHFHFVWLLRLRHRSKTFSFQYTAFSFLKCDEKIVNIIFYKKCLSPLIWFFSLINSSRHFLVNVLQTSSLLADISGSRSRTKETMIFLCYSIWRTYTSSDQSPRGMQFKGLFGEYLRSWTNVNVHYRR